MTPTASLWAGVMASSFSSCWKGPCHELSGNPTPRPGICPESIPGNSTEWSGGGLGESLPGSAESPLRCRNHLAQLCLRLCATSAKGRRGPNVRNCLIDEGRPLGTGWQEQVPNHLRRLWSKAMVVSTEGKGLERTRSGDWQEEDRKGTTDDMSKA